MLGKTISTNSLILGAFAAVTAGLIAFTYQSTEARIIAAERAAQQQALFEIVPPERHDNNMLNDVIVLEPTAAAALGLPEATAIHVAKQQGKPVALVIPTVAPDGYSGEIKMIVGVNIDGTVAGVRVLSHKETPGLGDKVDISKSPWVHSFAGKSLGTPKPEHWAVKKDGGAFDAFTGATITPRAVVRQVKHVLEYYQNHQAELLQASQTGATP